MEPQDFNIKNLCHYETVLALLPFTVSKDTFNTCYPMYQDLKKLDSNYTDRFEKVVDEKKEDKSDIFSRLNKKSFKIVYKKACIDYIKALKQYVKMFLSNDDFLINSYKYMTQFFKEENEVKLLHHYMDDDKLNFVRYLWLRRLNHAW